MTIDSPEGGDMFDFWGDVFSGVPMAQAGQRPNESRRAREARDPDNDASTNAAKANTRALEDSAQANRELAAALRERAVDTGADTGLD